MAIPVRLTLTVGRDLNVLSQEESTEHVCKAGKSSFFGSLQSNLMIYNSVRKD